MIDLPTTAHLQIASGLFALLSAILWFLVAFVRVPAPTDAELADPDDESGTGGGFEIDIIGGQAVVATARKQAELNRLAALAAGAAALCQTIASLKP